MLELLTIFVFIWLLGKAAGLALKLTWGAAKLIAGLLMVLAVPLLVVCLLFVGGIALMLPLGLLAIAFGIGKACG